MRRRVVLISLLVVMGVAATQGVLALSTPQSASGIETVPHEGALRILVSPGIDVGNDTKVLASVIGPYGTAYPDIKGISRNYGADQLVIRFREAAPKGLKVSWLAWNGDKPGDSASSPDLQVVLRENSRTVDVPPTGTGGTVGIASACLPGEVVISGGITGATADMKNLDYYMIGPFFDGRSSGWIVQWINRGTETVTLSATVAASCVPGSMTVGP